MDPRRVLIVDDDQDWRDFIKLSLDELGYATGEAENGEEALEALRNDHYGVVLLDLNMPGMSGLDVAQRLPAKGGPRVVFVTNSPAEVAAPALASGAHYYLPKGAGRDALALLMASLEV